MFNGIPQLFLTQELHHQEFVSSVDNCENWSGLRSRKWTLIIIISLGGWEGWSSSTYSLRKADGVGGWILPLPDMFFNILKSFWACVSWLQSKKSGISNAVLLLSYKKTNSIWMNLEGINANYGWFKLIWTYYIEHAWRCLNCKDSVHLSPKNTSH